MKKVLLHICCGPCAIYPWRVLEKQNFLVEGLFYNPNIEPYSEYNNRKSALDKLQRNLNLTLHYGDYEEDLYHKATKDIRSNKSERCRSCFRLRLEKTCDFASDKGFDYFTTTLLVSPYQDQEAIRDIGNRVCENKKSKFWFYDFREGFRQTQEKAKELNMYRQRYCGCLYSLEERNNQIKSKI